MSTFHVKNVDCNDSSLSSPTIKKSKRKRHKHRNKNSTFKRKRQKKQRSLFKFNNTNSETIQPRSNKVQIMSNWYWCNYKKALEWQDKNKAAHWKACALALAEENKQLLHIINTMQLQLAQHGIPTKKGFRRASGNGFAYAKLVNPSNSQNHSKSFCYSSQICSNVPENCDSESEDNRDITSENEDEVEFEMSEEMLKFFEESFKHKLELKKLREQQSADTTEAEVKEIQSNRIKRSTEMSFLYGEGASMIIGMETAVQLSFEKYLDSKTPKYWPNIPLKL